MKLSRRHFGTAADLVWYQGEACCVFHPMNAYEEGGTLIADMMRYDAAPGFPGADGSAPDPAKAVARLERWRLPLNATRYTVERLDEQASEYPRFDERYTGRAYRYGYFATTPGDQGRAAVFDQIARYDFATGHKDSFSVPAGDYVSEPIFVPRGADAPEGRGYLLVVVYRAAELRSDLLVLDAEQIAQGPLATAQLQTRVPFGFHGNWMPAH